MATQAFENNAATVFASTTAGVLPVGGLSFTVTTGGGAKFPSVTGGDYFYVTLFEKDGSDVEENYEVVKCTGVSGDTISISERDIDNLVGTSGGRAYPTIGGRTVYVQMRATAGTLGNFSQKTATETLSNKTFSGQTLIADGTAAAPSIAFSDDTDTGVYSSAANTVDIVSGTWPVLRANLSAMYVGMNVPASITIAPATSGVVTVGSSTAYSVTVGNSTMTNVLNLGTGSLAALQTQTINIGTGAASGTNNINIGGDATATTIIAKGTWQFNLGTASLPPICFTHDTNTGMYSPGADQLGFSTNGTSRLTIGSTGTVTLEAGQLKFPSTQNASADANTLDDYEEGDWVPTLGFQIPGTSSFTYATQSGRYTKIGRQVTVVFDIQLSAFTAGTASGPLAIQPLPFTPGSVKAAGALGLVENFTTLYPTAVVTEPGYTLGYFLSHRGDLPPYYIAPSSVSATSHIVGTITYFV